MKKIILFLLSLLICFAFVSCGECEHIDENNDGICDECKWDYDHTHTYEETASHDDYNHWYDVTCGHDVQEKDRASHLDENNDGICDGCAWDYGHTHTHESTWSHDNESHWRAVSCGHCAEVKDRASHADENNDGVCDVCAWDYGHTHSYASEWASDDNYHWHNAACGHSIDVDGKAAHLDENNDGLCDVCAWDYSHVHTYDKGWSFDGESHWHSPTCPHEIEPKDKAAHSDADTDGTCDVCGKEISPKMSEEIELPEIEF